MGEVEFWNQPIEQLLSELQATRGGLTSGEAQLRLRRYGLNETKELKPPSACMEFLGRFTSPLVIILLFASVLSAITGDIPSFVIVIAIVLLSVVMDFVQEMRARNAVEALRQKVGLRAKTLRDGSEIAVPVNQLVPGDIVRLIAGASAISGPATFLVCRTARTTALGDLAGAFSTKRRCDRYPLHGQDWNPHRTLHTGLKNDRRNSEEP